MDVLILSMTLRDPVGRKDMLGWGWGGGGWAAPRAHGLATLLILGHREAAVSDGGRTGVTSARARSLKESAVLKGLRRAFGGFRLDLGHGWFHEHAQWT